MVYKCRQKNSILSPQKAYFCHAKGILDKKKLETPGTAPPCSYQGNPPIRDGQDSQVSTEKSIRNVSPKLDTVFPSVVQLLATTSCLLLYRP